MYANEYMTIKEAPGIFIYEGKCQRCKQPQQITVLAVEFEKYRKGTLIQNALTSNTTDEREMLISGICPKCWDERVLRILQRQRH